MLLTFSTVFNTLYISSLQQHKPDGVVHQWSDAITEQRLSEESVEMRRTRSTKREGNDTQQQKFRDFESSELYNQSG